MQGKLTSGKDLGVLVQEIRLQAQLTQTQMAEHLNVSQRYLSELEAGKPKVLNRRFFDLLSMLGVELHYSTQTND